MERNDNERAKYKFFRAIIQLHLQHIHTMIKIPTYPSFENVLDNQDVKGLFYASDSFTFIPRSYFISVRFYICY